LFVLQTAENLATRQAGFAADKVHSYDKVFWDDGEEDDDAGSNAAAEGSSATHGDNESEELEDSGEPLSYSSKSPGPSSLRDWSKDDDDEPGPAATLGITTLHVAAIAAAGAQATPIVDLPDSPERHLVAPVPVTTKTAAPEGTGSGAAATKRRSQPAPLEPAVKRNKAEPAAKILLPPKGKRVVKRRATAVAG
jgi:hypothetical protein